MHDIDLEDLLLGTVTAYSSTTVVVDLGDGHVDTFTGVGFSGFNALGVPSAGTITDWKLTFLGTTIATVGNFSMSVPTFVGYLSSGNTTSFLNTLFRGNDKFVGSSENDVLFALAGNDRMDGKGGQDDLDGGSGNDVLEGRGAGDTLHGGDGADELSGGLGNDTMFGGAGADHFIFDTAPGSTNRDRIEDFSVVSDTIDLARSIFGALGPKGVLVDGRFHIGAAAHDAGDRIIYHSGNGSVLYDADGTGGQAAVKIATLDPGLALTAADFLVV